MNYKLINSNISGIHAEELYNYSVKKEVTIFTKFFAWCKAEEDNRFLWLGITFFGQIGLSLPLTTYCILFFGGNNLFLWILTCAVAVPSLILNLAALPTKITLPVLFFAWFAQVAIITYCIGFAFMQ